MFTYRYRGRRTQRVPLKDDAAGFNHLNVNQNSAEGCSLPQLEVVEGRRDLEIQVLGVLIRH